jgi:hypothetical protein
MANTNVLIKRSLTTGKPSSLLQGELAYSYLSNTIFIGSPSGNGVVNVGGQYYTSMAEQSKADIVIIQSVNTTQNNRLSTVEVNAQAAFDAANTGGAYVIDSVARNTANTADVRSSAAYNKANTGTVLAQAAYDQANTTQSNLSNYALSSSLSAYALTSSLDATSGKMESAYAQANTGTVLAQASFDSANVISGVNTTQNTNITVIQGVNASQNVRLDYSNAAITIIQGTDLTQNTRMTVIEGTDSSQNARMTIIEATDLTQNTAIASTDGKMQSAYNKANTGTVLAQAAYDYANTSSTFVRANTAISNQTIDSSVTITGNLFVQGTQFVTNTTTLNVADPLIYLASNNYTSDLVDIGFAGNYYDGTNERHTGVFRNAGDKQYYVFDNYLPEISGNNEIDVANSSFRLATLNANLVSTVATVGTLSLTNALTVPNGGTGATTFTNGAILVGSGSGALSTLANSSYTLTGALSTAKTITSLTVDAYGRLTAATGSDIAIDTSQISSGTLGVSRGGTGQTSFSSGGLVISDGTKLTQLANSSYTATGSGATNSTITSLTVDSYGRVTAATYSGISGLTVSQGGTGLSTITTNGITYGNGTGNLGVTAAAGTSDQTWSNQILTVTNSGVPVWASALDGGTF